jgi:hypothetical protein
MDLILKIFNFPMYVLEMQNFSLFLTLYEVLAGIIVVFIALVFGFADPLFRATKSGELKEGTKMVIKGMSIAMACLIFIL